MWNLRDDGYHEHLMIGNKFDFKHLKVDFLKLKVLGYMCSNKLVVFEYAWFPGKN
jgi:hypothetical protein